MLALGQVQIDAKTGHIHAVALTPNRLGTPDLGGPNHLICPGFIDAHVHVPQFDCLGVDGLTLLDWLNTAVFPTEARWADTDHAASVSERVARRLLSVGTTSIAAYATVHHAGAQAAINALARLGLRGVVGQVLMDQNAPAELLCPAEQLITEAPTLTPAERMHPAITPRFAVSCSRELLEGAGRLAASTGWMVQTHLSETVEECRVVESLHSGLDYVEVYRRAGLLTPRTILGHAIHLSDVQRRVLASTRSIAAHCPTANLFLQAGEMNLDAQRRSHIPVALGSDVAGGPDPCMIRVARAMIETAKRRKLSDPTVIVPTPAHAWWMITSGNARSLGWPDAGTLAPGAPADLVVINPSRSPLAQPAWTHAPDPLSLILYTFNESWIEHTLTAGRVHDIAGQQ